MHVDLSNILGYLVLELNTRRGQGRTSTSRSPKSYEIGGFSQKEIWVKRK